MSRAEIRSMLHLMIRQSVEIPTSRIFMRPCETLGAAEFALREQGFVFFPFVLRLASSALMKSLRPRLSVYEDFQPTWPPTSPDSSLGRA